MKKWYLMALMIGLAGPVDSYGSEMDAVDSTKNLKADSVKLTAQRPEAKNYLEDDVAFGGTVGTPGGFNFIAEGYYSRVGLRFEAGAFPWVLASAFGEQAELCFVLARGRSELVECSAFYSRSFTSSIDEANGNWNSNYGIAIAFNGKGFFVQAGFTPDYFKNFNAYHVFPSIFQIGYVH